MGRSPSKEETDPKKLFELFQKDELKIKKEVFEYLDKQAAANQTDMLTYTEVDVTIGRKLQAPSFQLDRRLTQHMRLELLTTERYAEVVRAFHHALLVTYQQQQANKIEKEVL